MIAILLVMLGGGIGAVLRALVTDICNRKFNSTIPIATPIVNIIGSFLIGIIMGFQFLIIGFHLSLLQVYLVV